MFICFQRSLLYKSFVCSVATLLSLFSVGLLAEDSAAASIPTTPLDMMQEMSTYFSGELSAQALFDMGVEANMRIPMEHLNVRFVDLRTNKEMSRDAIDEILGRARQGGSYDLIQKTFSRFAVPKVSPERAIDLFNAAALASMRVPPKHVDIEYYDDRVGYTGEAGGGVSGRVPKEMYQAPSLAADKLTEGTDDWSHSAIVEYFVANNVTFTPSNNDEVVLPVSILALSEHHLQINAHEELETIAVKSGMVEGEDIKLADHFSPLYQYAAVGFEQGKKRYIGLLHVSLADVSKVQPLRKLYSQLYDTPAAE